MFKIALLRTNRRLRNVLYFPEDTNEDESDENAASFLHGNQKVWKTSLVVFVVTMLMMRGNELFVGCYL